MPNTFKIYKNCPYCNSPNVFFKDLNKFSESEVAAFYGCNGCGQDWREIFTFSHSEFRIVVED